MRQTETTIDAIVRDAESIVGDGLFTRLLPLAHNWRRDYLRISPAIELRTAYLTVNDARIAELPPEFSEYVALGITRTDGSVLGLMVREGVAIGAAIDPDQPAVVMTWLGKKADVSYQDVNLNRAEGIIQCSSEIAAGSVLVLHFWSYSAKPGQATTVDARAHNWGREYVVTRWYLNPRGGNQPALAQIHQQYCNLAERQYKLDVLNLTFSMLRRAKDNSDTSKLLS